MEAVTLQAQRERPRFSPQIDVLPLRLPPGKSLGPAIAAARARNGDLFLLHHGAVLPDDRTDYMPHVLHFSPALDLLAAWGGPDHVPAADGVPQWPAGPEGLEIDAEGNIWIFGYTAGDSAVLKFNQSGELLRRFGQRGRAGNDGDTQFFGDGVTSCYHDVVNREVFFTDGYTNHRVIAFNSDTGTFTRMWGAYGEKPGTVSAEREYASPVHKIARGPNGLIYVCDRANSRIQEFELIPGGARFLREVHVAPGTPGFGATFDIAFCPDERFMLVADGTNAKIWTVELDSLEVCDSTSTAVVGEGTDNARAVEGLVHRFAMEPNGDLLLCATSPGFLRMRYLGVS